MNPASQAVSLGQWWCTNGSFYRQASISAKHYKVWGQSSGLMDGVVVHLLAEWASDLANALGPLNSVFLKETEESC